MTVTVPIFVNGASSSGSQVGLKIQLASDGSGAYVPVGVLDTETAISIGAVSQEGTWVINQGTGGSSAWKVDPSGVTSPVSAVSLPLPANAAQEAGGNLAALAALISAGKLKVDPSGVTSPVSLASLPALTTGSATIGAVNQGTSPWLVQHPDATSTGNTIAAATLNAAYTVSLANGEAATGFTISGLTASGATLTLEGSAADGVTFSAINEVQTSGVMGSTITTDGNYYVNTGGRTKVRLRVSVIGTGTITVASLASAASSRVTVQASLPPGTNEIGFVGPSGSNGVDYSANGPSLSGLILLATIPASSTRLGYFIQAQGTAALTVALDDQAGSLTPTIVVLGGAASTGGQGSAIDMGGLPHTGRIRIFSTSSGIQMAARAW
jgi:hypothetical protein